MLPPVRNRAETVERLSAWEGEIRALGVSRLALFGSVLRGQTHADSDVDVLVQFAPGAKTYDRFFALSELLERCLSRRVELITTEALSPFIGPRILDNGAQPSRKAVASIRKNIRRRLWRGNQAPWEDVARDLNRTVRGWCAYFSYGSVTTARHHVEQHLYQVSREGMRRCARVGFGRTNAQPSAVTKDAARTWRRRSCTPPRFSSTLPT